MLNTGSQVVGGVTMKKSTGSILLVAAIMVNSAALAEDRINEERTDDEPVHHTEVLTGIDTNSTGSFFGYTAFNIAPGKGGLDESGLRFWLLGSGGFYHYPGDRDTFSEIDVLVGYGIERDNLSANFYVGLNSQYHQLAVPDPENPVQGLGVGVKFRTDTWYNPTPMTLLYGDGEYSTAFGTYYASGKYGYSFAGGQTLEDKHFYIGPQISLLGDIFYQEWRIGAHVTSFNLGKVDFVIGGGYSHNSENGSGGYAIVELSTKF
jgi:hypothetical protein